VTWTQGTALAGLAPAARRELDDLHPVGLAKGSAVFHPGDTATGFPVVLSGRVDVFLVGPTGREILLYSVTPGQSCVQTTLGLLGGAAYGGEAVAASDTRLVLVPAGLFTALMGRSEGFRRFVFRAFADRMQSTMHVLEMVAFRRVEARLAEALVGLAEDGEVTVTQAELAARIGSAREVVSRRLDSFARRGWVTVERGHVSLTDPAALAAFARSAEA